MDIWTEGPLRPGQKFKWKKPPLSVLFILTALGGFLVWIFWCYFKYPCFNPDSERCVEYGKEQDSLNPQVSEIKYSFLATPGELVYPWISTLRREEGSVALSVYIDAEGNIISKDVIESSGFKNLDEAAVESLSTFQVDLEKLKNTEFPVRKDIKFTFNLRQK